MLCMYEGRRPEEPRHVSRTKGEHVSVCISSDQTTKSDDAGSSPNTVGASGDSCGGRSLKYHSELGITRIVAGVIVGLVIGVAMYLAHYYGNRYRNWARFGGPSS